MLSAVSSLLGERKTQTTALAPAGSGMLTKAEIKIAEEFFNTYDRNKSGCLDVWELRLALESLGQMPTEDELKEILAGIDENRNGTLDFKEFLKSVQKVKRRGQTADREADLKDAFVALGGKPDKSGFINGEQLRKVLKEDFGMVGLRVEELIGDLDRNNDGFINFEEFRQLLT